MHRPAPSRASAFAGRSCRLVLGLVLGLFATLAPSLASAQEASTPSLRYRVPVRAAQLERALAILDSFDVLGACSCKLAHRDLAAREHVDVIVRGDDAKRLRRAFPSARLVDISRPFHEIRRARRAASTAAAPPDAGYYTVAEMEAELAKLETRFPALAQRIDITARTRTAKTHEGRSLYAIKISDNVRQDENEAQILLASQHHARELNSPHVTLRAAQRLLEGYATTPAIRQLVDANEIWIVPMVNPDGVDAVWNVDRYWRKNRAASGNNVHGVDLNRNYPFRWGVCGASSRMTSQIYKGSAAGSEPETKTMMALARMQRFEKYLDFHSFGQEVLDTYSPCTSNAYTNTPLAAMLAHFRDRLAAPANYRTRPPSASGEAQEWHWAENGTLSFLVEVGRSFQPEFRETEAEEARVWPAIFEFLKWRPSLYGSVRSLRKDAPLGASLDARALGYRFAEISRSSARTGRYHLWLPAGRTDVVLDAPQHDSKTASVLAPSLGSSLRENFVLLPTLPVISLAAPAQMQLGTSVNVALDARDPGTEYWIAMSLGTSPATRVGPRSLALHADGLFWLSAQPIPGFYTGQLGVLDGAGRARARFAFPNVPAFAGLRFWFAGVTLEDGWPLRVKAISAPTSITLTR